MRILDAAEVLVLRNGFAATSVDDILRAADSSKGAFFHHFASKAELASALVERYVDADVAELRKGLDAVADEADPVDRLLSFVGYYERWAEQLVAEEAGCVYIAALAELDLLDDTTSRAVRRGIQTWRAEFGSLLRPALAAARVKSTIDVDELADHLFATFEGAYLMCRSLQSAEPMRAQLRVFRQLLTVLLKR
ncbi:MAG: TetR/AcrR family transcriptional regulator [Frankiales bacterium]|nr:TetR/AcrR family transcriptional regulator [Frankiales bacterium]